jgi:hypothetical protein
MHALLPGQVDQLGSLSDCTNRRLDNSRGRAGNRNHRAVVVRIHRPVKQMHSLHAHGSYNRFNPPEIGALGEIRNAFNNRFGHIYFQ